MRTHGESSGDGGSWRTPTNTIGEADVFGTTQRHRAATPAGAVSYLDVGAADAPPAVFLHGLGTSALLWRHVLPRVQDLRRCVAIDLPLHGSSPWDARQSFSLPALADLVVSCCDHVGLDRFDLVANDTGGAIAQLVAVRHRRRVRSLTLTNCDVYNNIPTRAFLPTYLLARTGLLPLVVRSMMRNLSRARRLGYGAGYQDVATALPLPVAQAWLDPLIGTAARARTFQRCILAVKAADLVAVESELTQLTIPTHLVWGTADPFFPVGWARRLQATIPTVESLDLIEGGHLFFPDERWQDLVPLLRRHWESPR